MVDKVITAILFVMLSWLTISVFLLMIGVSIFWWFLRFTVRAIPVLILIAVFMLLIG